MTSTGARCQAMKRMPGVMKPSGVSGISARTMRMRSHGSSACVRTAIAMCVLLVKSIAWKPTRSITGAISAIIAVVSASALQRLWWPSRTVVSTSPIMRAGCGRARRRRRPPCRSSRQTSATTPREPATTALISFMTSRMQTCVLSSTAVPTVDERRLARAGRAVERPDHRRGDVDEPGGASARGAGARRGSRSPAPHRGGSGS